ncbi:hypothetical protein [Capnocytophaga cynodegmi]|uniref:Uncharacterized protein n=1 Tax=Capnocytophaga cynodegmi TaxID=28189 RepID=A0A0B7H0H7_9FLAO|nr:hypothetical protein [Capnocytophaga cynodegmi]CEN32895.1 conserved hypothetical protein [Capnocytophaga cynodegmi]
MDNFKKVENIDEKLEKIETLYTISAYLRSAIKEKDNRINEISQKTLQIRQKSRGKSKKIDFEALDKLKNVTIEDFLKTLPLEEVIKYKSCKAKAAHIGKFIHNFDALCEDITKKELISLRQIGEKVFKIINVPLHEIEELQILQEKLLAQHREFESEVNFYKAKFREFENQSKVILST